MALPLRPLISNSRVTGRDSSFPSRPCLLFVV
jgi:hypothetical protein